MINVYVKSFTEIRNMHDFVLPIYTIYRYPQDFPGQYVCRMFDVRAGSSNSTPYVAVANTVKAIRATLPPGVMNIGRQSGDDPAIAEVWI